MTNFPAPLTYGTIFGYLTSAYVGGVDLAGGPDLVPLSGYVIFSPSVVVVKAPVSDPPLVLVRQAILCTLVDGHLTDPDGNVGVRLLASDSPGVTPEGVTWQVSFHLSDVISQPESFTFAVAGGSTVDLTTLVSTAGLPATVTVPAEDVDVETVVAEYFTAHPTSGSEPLLEVHLADATPHPVYDDIPSLTLIFENGLI